LGISSRDGWALPEALSQVRPLLPMHPSSSGLHGGTPSIPISNAVQLYFRDEASAKGYGRGSRNEYSMLLFMTPRNADMPCSHCFSNPHLQRDVPKLPFGRIHLVGSCKLGCLPLRLERFDLGLHLRVWNDILYL